MSKMSDKKSRFLKLSEEFAFNKEHRHTLAHNLKKYDEALAIGKERLNNLEQLRQIAYNTKYHVLRQLDKYLIEFETNFQNNGGKVIWAKSADDAINEILQLLEKEQVEKVVKSKSMTTEEIQLNTHLEKKNIQVFETDLGEFIVQTADEKPYHIVTPAIHKSKEDIAALFAEKFDFYPDASPQELTEFARKYLRDAFLTAGAAITGANFLISDSGSVAITENEGNAILSMAKPKLHIVVAGIEKILPSTEDLDLFWPLLATFGTGQTLTAYNSLISGPVANGSGPTQMVVILLDNGRTNLLAKSRRRMSLACIGCGACSNVCPVYKTIGGHGYDTTYSGPIGAVITPHLKGLKEYQHLSFASTLCGACTEVCPVHIPIHEMLLLNRNEAVNKHLIPKKERSIIKHSTRVLKKRSLLDMASGKTKTKVLKYFISKQWGNRREMPQPAKKSFSQIWKENQNIS